MENENNGTTGVLIVGIVIGIIGTLIFHHPNYEGMSAEEWFNEYDYAVGCLEEVSDEAGNITSSYDYDELRDSLDNIYYTANGCI